VVEEALGRLRQEGVEVAFIALHGPRGEDGTVQGLLEIAGIPYTGPQVTSAAATMDKRLTKEVLRAAGIPTPRSFQVGPEAPRVAGKVDWRRILLGGQECFPFPWVLKPNRLGSSVGVFIAEDGEQFLKQALEAERYLPWARGGHPERGGEILVEEFIRGRELTCGVAALADGLPRPLPPIEIRPVSRAFFDYHAKYTPGATEEICPAPLTPDLTRQVQALAVAVHRALRADPLSRTDFIVDAEGTPQVLEINTIPGMTATSLIPLSASRAGLDLGALLRALVEHAVRRAGGE
jgi:D-alanine-D-alanine ligase